ncbi:alkaline phosphatase family protein [Rhodococcus sp. ARC_M6]|uniref:alkaline phosphatase family protein n=1 Tax=Rhodococcus sp. ARC_M6 TaxID=2928852 RepID=UPI001FB1C5B4|nr:alkaline phosphatase family protein [Rhodococcus sp. ARC_M6]MCJ0903484.1 alkaline phosphatase family protein [Rhodococcus sp. ARC_M6]
MNQKIARTSVALTFLLAGAVVAGTMTAAASPGSSALTPAATQKTVVIGLDGTMLSHIKTADAPNLHKLIAEGTSGESSILGHTTISGPSWSTILTGVWDTKHRVMDNTFAGARYDLYPTVFTRIEAANPALLTESISTWGGINNIASSGTPKADLVITTPDAGSIAATDIATANAVVAAITDRGPDLIFTQLDQVDGAGHAAGTNGPGYKKGIETVDVEVGRIINAVDARAAKTGEQWTVLVTADHGHKPWGGHGGQSAAEATSFVIARGAGYTAGKATGDYTIADITPTILRSLGITVPANLDITPSILRSPGIAVPANLDGKPLTKEAPGFTGSVDLGFFGS